MVGSIPELYPALAKFWKFSPRLSKTEFEDIEMKVRREVYAFDQEHPQLAKGQIWTPYSYDK